MQNNKDLRDEVEHKILEDIERFGWSVINVFDSEKKNASFSYSVGVSKTLFLPEILIFGMEGDDAKKIINFVADYIKAGSTIELHKVYYNFIEDSWPCIFIEVDTKYSENFAFLNWFYGIGQFKLIQCVWADENGNFPWDVGFNQKIKHLQKICGELKNKN